MIQASEEKIFTFENTTKEFRSKHLKTSLTRNVKPEKRTVEFDNFYHPFLQEIFVNADSMFRCRLFALFHFGMYPLFNYGKLMQRANWIPINNVVYFFQSLSQEKISLTILNCSIKDFGKNENNQFNHFGDTNEQKDPRFFNKFKLPYAIETIWQKNEDNKEEFISGNVQLTIPYFNESFINFEIESCQGICRYHDLIFIVSEEKFALLYIDESNNFARGCFLLSNSKHEFQEEQSSILLTGSQLHGLSVTKQAFGETNDYIMRISLAPQPIALKLNGSIVFRPDPFSTYINVNVLEVKIKDEVIFLKTMQKILLNSDLSYPARSVPIIRGKKRNERPTNAAASNKNLMI